ncbi:MAG: DUF2786 domain-containing protein [Rhodospirillaceae bacterium]|nr:DUF2786 domain-containing protein [Rhodospirillaceae bacterium]
MIDIAARRRLRETIAALSTRTTERGCTEAEAMAAAAKVAELLSKHGLDPVALEFEEGRIEIGRRTVVDEIWSNVATFCHCKLWYSGCGGRWTVVYFGRWNDVIVAEYLHALLERHVKAATREWQKTQEYRRRRSTKTKREATKAFQQGLVRALAGKLWDQQWRRTPKVEGGNHLALVLSPLAAVEAEMERCRIDLSGKPLAPVKGAGKRFDNEQWSGRAAARNIDINAAVNGGRRPGVAALLPAMGGDRA